ncbi:hypothetical protein FUT87_03870 [Mitsuaria sp. TWR114]|uniref:hypothetical protein n=1 Tax=Mitsuaria sp. TWR114 TaxID=2601731 RepID=UPI0011BF145D|nr:hypothetical protein [Mitsuaria sp. TWR114]TXD99048.1 hypothetical protein FUT87_03870 [Mitsuaria sp. TWR114]
MNAAMSSEVGVRPERPESPSAPAQRRAGPSDGASPGQRSTIPAIPAGPRMQRVERVADLIHRSPRMATQRRALDQVAQREPWDPAAAAQETLASAAQNARLPGVVAPHPVAIGAQQDPGDLTSTQGAQRHFDPEMRDQVSQLLNYLPAEHIIGNPALARVVCERTTDENPGISFYDGNDQTLHVVVPGNVSSWLYMSIDRWPVGDLVTTLMTNYAYATEEDNHGNLTNPNVGHKASEVLHRDVLGRGTVGSKLEMVGENFVRWLLTHETGHSVDQAIGFVSNGHHRQPWAASWDIHAAGGGETALMNRFTGGLNLNMAVLNAQYTAATGANFDAVMTAAVVDKEPWAFDVPGRNAALNGYEGVVAGGRAQVEYLERVVRKGLDSPWQLGGTGGIAFGGRNYHVEYQHSRWVSYDAARYADRNSNYQYSGPDEWFAESYAHYFKHNSLKFWRTNHGQWGEQLRDPITRTWFLANLDPINGAGALIAANQLQAIPGVGPAIAGPVAGGVAVPAQPGKLETLGRGLVKVAELSASGLLRILSTVFGIAGGLLKLFFYLPGRAFWRWLTG